MVWFGRKSIAWIVFTKQQSNEFHFYRSHRMRRTPFTDGINWSLANAVWNTIKRKFQASTYTKIISIHLVLRPESASKIKSMIWFWRVDDAIGAGHEELLAWLINVSWSSKRKQFCDRHNLSVGKAIMIYAIVKTHCGQLTRYSLI